jgi:hypothetical protein
MELDESRSEFGETLTNPGAGAMSMERDADDVRLIVGHMSENGTAILRHPDAAGLHQMWSALRGARTAPFRAELDAGKIGARAPFLAILEHVGPSNFRIRIAGDRLNRWFGMELRGMSALSMVDGPSRNHVQAALNRVVADPAVAVVRGAATAMDGQSARYELVFLPMRSDFGRIDRILTGLWLLDAGAPSYPFQLAVEEVQLVPIDAEVSHAPFPPAPALPPVEVAATEAGPDETAEARPPLRSIDGAPNASGKARRGHLRLVKS